MANTSPTAALIIIGNEILSGRTQDLNLNFIAKELVQIGIRFNESIVIADDEKRIIEVVNDYRKRFDYVFTTGGIGPTHDDITSHSIAKAFNVAIERNKEAVARLTGYYEEGALNDARLKMAEIPVGASLIDNPISAAPGFIIENVYVLAGVPSIMQTMLLSIIPNLANGTKIHSREIGGNYSESAIANDLSNLQNTYPSIDIGSYPFMKNNKIGVHIVLRCEDEQLLDQCHTELENLLKKHSK